MHHPRVSLVQIATNPFAKNASVALSEANLLHEVITTLAYDPKGSISRYFDSFPNKLSRVLRKELERRTWTLPNSGRICSHPKLEILRLGLQRSGISKHLNIDSARLVDGVSYSLDKHVSESHLSSVEMIYAYEDVAATTFSVAKRHGILCLYDLAIMFYKMSRSIQVEEAERFPELSPALVAVHEPKWKLERKEQEIELADHIIVASSITYQSLINNGVAAERISIIPYGAPIDYFYPHSKKDQCFRALFIGQVTPRKGVHYLLKAWKELNLSAAELMLVGMNFFPTQWLQQYDGHFRHVGSVPHKLLNSYYSSGSVFVFPSLVEGFGMVLLEAMACGVPIITTPNTAGPDIITDGVEGFIIPIRDVEALKEKLEWCYLHPQELAEMGRAARRKAEQLTWNSYRHQLVAEVKQLFNSRT